MRPSGFRGDFFIKKTIWIKFLNNLDISKLEKFENPKYITGIYFLFKNNEIIYIGKSCYYFTSFISSKKGNKDFDFFKYIVIDEKF